MAGADVDFLSEMQAAEPAPAPGGEPPAPLDFFDCLANKGPVPLAPGDQARDVPIVDIFTNLDPEMENAEFEELARKVLSYALGCDPNDGKHTLDFLVELVVAKFADIQTLAVSTRLLKCGELWYKNYTAILYVAAQMITKKALWDGVKGVPSYLPSLILLVKKVDGDLDVGEDENERKAVLPFAFRAVYNALVLRFNSNGTLKKSITS